MYPQLFVSFALIWTDVGVMSKLSGQRRVSARHPSPALLRRVCQSGVDIDESKLDGDSVRPVRRLIITGRNPFDHPLRLPHSLLVSGCPSPSPLCLFSKTPEADERSPLWHMTHTLLSFEFFHLTDPSTTPRHTTKHHTTPPPPHPYLPTHMHACTHPHTASRLSSLAPRQDRPWRNSCCVTQWKNCGGNDIRLILFTFPHTDVPKSLWCFISSYLNIVTRWQFVKTAYPCSCRQSEDQ